MVSGNDADTRRSDPADLLKAFACRFDIHPAYEIAAANSERLDERVL